MRGGQVRVAAEHQPGVIGGGEQQFAVADRIGEAVGGEAALLQAQWIAAADDARLVLGRDPDLTSPRGEAVRVLEALFDWRNDRPGID